MTGEPILSRVILAGIAALTFTASSPGPALAAQEPIVFPGKGQSDQQMEQDKEAASQGLRHAPNTTNPRELSP